MKRYLSFIILIIGMTCAVSYELPENESKHYEINDKSTQNFTSNHLTVLTEMGSRKTMTDTLGQDDELSQGRTFAVKRLQFMLLPLMYKMGVMSTLLVILVALSFKSFLVGIILLVIKVGGFLAKFHYKHHEEPWHPPSYSLPEPQHPQPPVHIHLHNPDSHHHHPHDDHADFDHSNHHVQEQIYSKLDYMQPLNPYENPTAMDRRGQYIVYKNQ